MHGNIHIVSIVIASPPYRHIVLVCIRRATRLVPIFINQPSDLFT